MIGDDLVMRREDEIKKMLRSCFREFKKELAGRKVILFGSRADGTARDRSDFDIGIVGPGPLPLKTFFRIEDRLDNLDTLYKLDWVDLNRADELFRDEALKHVEVLYAG